MSSDERDDTLDPKLIALSTSPEEEGEEVEEEQESEDQPTQRVIEMTVSAGERPERIDQFLSRVIANTSRSKVQEGIASGAVFVNGETLERPSYKIKGGDTIKVIVPRPPRQRAEAEDIPLDIIYEDDQLLVINKAAGMVVHPAHGSRTGTLVNALLHHIQDFHRDHPGADPDRPGIVHRLDKDTSGLMVVAKTEEAHRVLAKQFFDHTAKRVYNAIVWGRLKNDFGRIETQLARHPKDRKKMAVVEEGGKNAITEYFLMEDLEVCSLVELRLKTGRTHQIRVHMQHLGNPVFGDPTYSGRSLHVMRNDIPQYRYWIDTVMELMPRQALHARTLRLHHPKTNELLEWTSPLPDDFEETLTALRAKRDELERLIDR
ncbi:MAG TPA: RluA family pseudouridine synthase [Candidatus Kapabacteria bacterium]|nr:RluA family pseudouridine synthase [Candidatus Kapabacteria bacterium]